MKRQFMSEVDIISRENEVVSAEIFVHTISFCTNS